MTPNPHTDHDAEPAVFASAPHQHPRWVPRERMSDDTLEMLDACAQRAGVDPESRAKRNAHARRSIALELDMIGNVLSCNRIPHGELGITRAQWGVLRAAYGLAVASRVGPAARAQIVQDLMLGKSPYVIAEENGCSYTTVRNIAAEHCGGLREVRRKVMADEQRRRLQRETGVRMPHGEYEL